jgi:hypothetical protein
MPVSPVRLDAQASRLPVESVQLAIAELDMLDRFVSIVRVVSLEMRWMIACIVAVC